MKINILARAAAIAVAALAISLNAWADTQHVVKKNESLYGIAYKYNISTDELLKYNPQASHGLRVGMVLTIPDLPGSEFSPSDPNPPGGKKEEANPDAKPTAPEQPEAAPQPVEAPQPAQPAAAAQPQESDTYIAEAGDTFAKIADKCNVSADKLLELNPFIDPYYVIAGTRVRLADSAPDYDFSPAEAFSHSEPQAEQEPAPAPVPEIEIPIAEPEPEVAVAVVDEETPEEGDDDEEEEADVEIEEPEDEEFGDFFTGNEALEAFVGEFDESMRRHNILVLLPFMAGEESASKQAAQYADFYRGLLLAANDMSLKTPGPEVEIFAQDTRNRSDLLRQQLEQYGENEIAVIIAPEDESQMADILEFASPRGIYVLNLFNLKDESYRDNQYMLHGYITAQAMYEKAIDGLMSEYEGFTPVILSPANARTEKDPFIEALRGKYAEEGIQVVDLPFEDTLTIEDIDAAGFVEPDGKYVFIPRSGSLTVFNRFASAVSDLRKRDDNPGRFATFGYPDWTAFRSEQVDILRNLEASVYTRFFYDDKSEPVRLLQHDFTNWYGTAMREGIPNQGALGYDTGKMLIKWLQESNGNLGSMLDGMHTCRGLQSTYSFSHEGGSEGYINDSLYIVRFLPGGRNEIVVL